MPSPESVSRLRTPRSSRSTQRDALPPSPPHFARRLMRLSLLALLPLLPLLSCAVGRLGAPSPAVAARARLLRIEDTRQDEPAYLDSLLADPNSSTRGLAALAVGRIAALSHV